MHTLKQLLFSLVTLLALCLGACGDDDNPPPTNPDGITVDGTQADKGKPDGGKPG